MAAPPEGHPEIDYTKWSPPGPGDVRSPCPAINALANHGILPHNGKGITKDMAIKAICQSINFNPTLASVFATGGVAANPDHSTHTFDLNHVNKHNWIEHDVSLSRQDIAFGSNSEFNKEKFETFIKGFGDVEATTFESASKVRYERVRESKEQHEQEGKEWTYGVKEVTMSYGETALYLNLLGHDGVAPLEWVRVLFGMLFRLSSLLRMS
ncbi:Cloroperoxidase [Tothia fuscella]|uniref:Cloroperoxidase n=1 Tax=Tothia fuscella TaxID=1048955 RepID=A0A9P4TZB6_9PEZI|nr:Cloroperoxidase [Tothia fuscella]